MTKRAYQYRFYPTPEQAHNLACTFGCCRFVYNWALKLRKAAYFQEGKKLYHKDLSARLPALKKAEREGLAQRGVFCASATSLAALG